MTAPESRALESLAVLVPRTPKQEDPFCALLADRGARPQVLPVIEIQPLLATPAAQRQAATELAAADRVVFVSGNAVDLALAALRACDLDFAPGAALYAVGKATASRLEAGGREVSYPSAEATSEGLLAEPGLAQVRGDRILICRGRGGRDTLREGLIVRGADVRYLDLYLRAPSVRHRDQLNALLAGSRVDVAAIHSGDVLTALWACLDQPARHRLVELPLLVPGERVAALARQQGCRRVVVAASALPEDMVTALVHWYTRQQSGGASPGPR